MAKLQIKSEKLTPFGGISAPSSLIIVKYCMKKGGIVCYCYAFAMSLHHRFVEHDVKH